MVKRCALGAAWLTACIVAGIAVVGIAIEVEHFNPASGTF